MMSKRPSTIATLPTADAASDRGWYKWELLGLLWVAFFLHQGDRQICNSVVPLIRDGLGINDVQIGLVGTVFTFVYGVLVPVAGFAGDWLPRKWIVFLSLVLFSAGTFLSGLSTGLVTLVLFRSLTTAGGEALFYPSATSLLAQWHPNTRAMALGILQSALYAGITLSGLLAGYLGECYGWRSAFVAFGSAGLAWAIVVAWRMRNTPQIRDTPSCATAGLSSSADADNGQEALLDKPAVAPSSDNRIPLGEVLAHITRRPSAWLLSLAFGVMVYVNVGYLAWTPTFLHEEFGLSLAWAGFNAMLYHHLFALVGVLLGGRLTDRLCAYRPTIRMEANCLGLLLGAPFLYWIGQAPTERSCYVALALFGLFRGIYDSNLFASLYDVIEPRLRASATGLMLSFAFVVGSLSPVVLGWMKTRVGLAAGLSSLAWFYLFGAACVFVAVTCFFQRDRVPAAASISE